MRVVSSKPNELRVTFDEAKGAYYIDGDNVSGATITVTHAPGSPPPTIHFRGSNNDHILFVSSDKGASADLNLNLHLHGSNNSIKVDHFATNLEVHATAMKNRVYTSDRDDRVLIRAGAAENSVYTFGGNDVATVEMLAEAQRAAKPIANTLNLGRGDDRVNLVFPDARSAELYTLTKLGDAQKPWILISDNHSAQNWWLYPSSDVSIMGAERLTFQTKVTDAREVAASDLGYKPAPLASFIPAVPSAPGTRVANNDVSAARE